MSQTALITGGSGGIGLALAKRLAADGYQLVLVARRQNELEQAAAVIASMAKQSGEVDPKRRLPRLEDEPRNDQTNNTVITIAEDLNDPAAPQRIVNELTKQQLTVDVLVNNAGFGLLGPFASNDPVKESGMIQVNVTALTELTKLLLPGMIKRKKGRILNVASTAAFQPGPFMAVYYATKSYVLSFSEALAEELRGTGVTVTCLAPGPTKTGFQDRAAIRGIPLFSAGAMNAEVVADLGYRALLRGQRLVIPGWRNALGAWLVRLIPRSMALRFVRQIQEPHRE